MANPLLTEQEIALVTAVIGTAPRIGEWIGGLINGTDVDPSATRRVSDILPEQSASGAVADELRKAPGGG